jgi:uncharacterized integral membrane protein
MRLFRRSDEEAAETPEGAAAEQESRFREWQPRLYLKLIVLLATIAYVVAFVLENRKQVKVHFVLGGSRVSLIWLILLSLALGVLGGVLLSQFYRRRHRRH